MLTLVILGLLLDHAAHGYAIKQTLDKVRGSRKVSWGSLYPMLGKLEKDSLIKKIETKELSGGPSQKVYIITEAGRRHFYELISQSAVDSENTRVHLRYKLLFFSRISKEDRISILHDYKKYLADRLGGIQKNLQEYQEQKSSRKSPYILEVLEHTLATYHLENEWVKKLLSKEGGI